MKKQDIDLAYESAYKDWQNEKKIILKNLKILKKAFYKGTLCLDCAEKIIDETADFVKRSPF